MDMKNTVKIFLCTISNAVKQVTFTEREENKFLGALRFL